jgi:hypothetical protein
VPGNEYHFITHWRVKGTREEVADVLGEALALPRWWPSVYLEVKELEPAAADGTGHYLSAFTRGWLPYNLRWNFRVTAIDYPAGFSIAADGDFDGRGIWTFVQDGDFVDITYDWKLRADKPVLRYLSPVMKPIFAANHRWAMERGLESLRIELASRRAPTEEARRALPAPPGPSGLFVRRKKGSA